MAKRGRDVRTRRRAAALVARRERRLIRYAAEGSLTRIKKLLKKHSLEVEAAKEEGEHRRGGRLKRKRRRRKSSDDSDTGFGSSSNSRCGTSDSDDSRSESESESNEGERKRAGKSGKASGHSHPYHRSHRHSHRDGDGGVIAGVIPLAALDLTATDSHGWSALHHAAHAGAWRVMRLLLLASLQAPSSFVGVRQRGERGSGREREEGRYAGAVRRAAEAVAARDGKGDSVWHVAARGGQGDVLKELRMYLKKTKQQEGEGSGADDSEDDDVAVRFMHAKNEVGETAAGLVERRVRELREEGEKRRSGRERESDSVWLDEGEGMFGWTREEEEQAEAPVCEWGSDAWRREKGEVKMRRNSVGQGMEERLRADEERHGETVRQAREEERERERERRKEAERERARVAQRLLEEQEEKDRRWREAVRREGEVRRQSTYASRWLEFNTRVAQEKERRARGGEGGIGFSDVPFPVEAGRDEEELRGVMLAGVAADRRREKIREEVIRWHPDKFMQKWGSLLRERERERVLLRVKEVSQAVNKVYATLK